MNRGVTVLVILVLFACLALVRWFESDLFYDPLLQYFKANATKAGLPEINTTKLLLHISYRFFLNTLLSLWILWFWFKDKNVIKIASFLFAIFFLVGIILCYISIQDTSAHAHLFLFYVRRFLIQPLLLLLLIPAFYFQRKNY